MFRDFSKIASTFFVLVGFSMSIFCVPINVAVTFPAAGSAPAANLINNTVEADPKETVSSFKFKVAYKLAAEKNIRINVSYLKYLFQGSVGKRFNGDSLMQEVIDQIQKLPSLPLIIPYDANPQEITILLPLNNEIIKVPIQRYETVADLCSRIKEALQHDIAHPEKYTSFIGSPLALFAGDDATALDTTQLICDKDKKITNPRFFTLSLNKKFPPKFLKKELPKIRQAQEFEEQRGNRILGYIQDIDKCYTASSFEALFASPETCSTYFSLNQQLSYERSKLKMENIPLLDKRIPPGFTSNFEAGVSRIQTYFQSTQKYLAEKPEACKAIRQKLWNQKISPTSGISFYDQLASSLGNVQSQLSQPSLEKGIFEYEFYKRLNLLPEAEDETVGKYPAGTRTKLDDLYKKAKEAIVKWTTPPSSTTPSETGETIKPTGPTTPPVTAITPPPSPFKTEKSFLDTLHEHRHYVAVGAAAVAIPLLIHSYRIYMHDRKVKKAVDELYRLNPKERQKMFLKIIQRHGLEGFENEVQEQMNEREVRIQQVMQKHGLDADEPAIQTEMGG